MKDERTGTWNWDPAHFQRQSRREFLYIGLIGGIGGLDHGWHHDH